MVVRLGAVTEGQSIAMGQTKPRLEGALVADGSPFCHDQLPVGWGLTRFAVKESAFRPGEKNLCRFLLRGGSPGVSPLPTIFLIGPLLVAEYARQRVAVL